MKCRNRIAEPSQRRIVHLGFERVPYFGQIVIKLFQLVQRFRFGKPALQKLFDDVMQNIADDGNEPGKRRVSTGYVILATICEKHVCSAEGMAYT
jgi:hypothetical protein